MGYAANYDIDNNIFSYFLHGTGGVISLIIYILLIVANWKIFEKAGEEGWTSIIPVYNLYILFRIVYGKGWKFILILIPVLNVIVSIALCFRLANVFGKGLGFGFGLLFLPNIFTFVLGFGSSYYKGSVDSFI